MFKILKVGIDKTDNVSTLNSNLSTLLKCATFQKAINPVLLHLNVDQTFISCTGFNLKIKPSVITLNYFSYRTLHHVLILCYLLAENKAKTVPYISSCWPGKVATNLNTVAEEAGS